MATLYKTDGTVETVEVNGLEDLQKHVGGLIEVIPEMRDTTNSKTHLFLANEEGMMKELPINKTFPLIVGNVLRVELGKEFD